MILAGDDFILRRLTEADIPLMARWLSDDRVLEFYEGRDKPFDEEAVRQHWFDADRGRLTQCIVEWDQMPIGYQQFYPLTTEEKAEYAYPPEADVWGMDQFIGLPELWSQGLGTRFVRLVAEHAQARSTARIVTTDPRVVNARAIRCYQKAGFERIRVLPHHEFHEGEWWDGWLMVFRG